jgi:hypothetical protein
MITEARGFRMEQQEALEYLGVKRTQFYHLRKKYQPKEELENGKILWDSEQLREIKKAEYGDHNLDFAIIGKRRDGSSVSEAA